MTTRSSPPPSSRPTTMRSANRPAPEGAFTPRLYNRSRGIRRRDQGRVLLPLVTLPERGAHGAVRDPRAPSRAPARGDPAGPLRDEPLLRRADRAAARPARPTARDRRGRGRGRQV